MHASVRAAHVAILSSIVVASLACGGAGRPAETPSPTPSTTTAPTAPTPAPVAPAPVAPAGPDPRAAAVAKCKSGCNKQCSGASNKAKCVGTCRRACE